MYANRREGLRRQHVFAFIRALRGSPVFYGLSDQQTENHS